MDRVNRKAWVNDEVTGRLLLTRKTVEGERASGLEGLVCGKLYG